MGWNHQDCRVLGHFPRCLRCCLCHVLLIHKAFCSNHHDSFHCGLIATPAYFGVALSVQVFYLLFTSAPKFDFKSASIGIPILLVWVSLSFHGASSSGHTFATRSRTTRISSGTTSITSLWSPGASGLLSTRRRLQRRMVPTAPMSSMARPTPLWFG